MVAVPRCGSIFRSQKGFCRHHSQEKTARDISADLSCFPATVLQATAAQTGGTVQPPKLLIQQHVLHNGFRPHHWWKITRRLRSTFRSRYHVGSEDEQVGLTGFAHLFDHLMFKGSAHVGPHEHSRIIQAAGGFDNAYTSDDVTVYWKTFPANYLERVIGLKADRMGSLSVNEANFKSEREVVKEERRVGVENVRPTDVCSNTSTAKLSSNSPRTSTRRLGVLEDLNKATIRDVVCTSIPPITGRNNATMVIVGDFTPSQASYWADRHFLGIPRPRQRLCRA